MSCFSIIKKEYDWFLILFSGPKFGKFLGRTGKNWRKTNNDSNVTQKTLFLGSCDGFIQTINIYKKYPFAKNDFIVNCKTRMFFAQSVEAVEYTDCFSEEG